MFGFNVSVSKETPLAILPLYSLYSYGSKKMLTSMHRHKLDLSFKLQQRLGNLPQGVSINRKKILLLEGTANGVSTFGNLLVKLSTFGTYAGSAIGVGAQMLPLGTTSLFQSAYKTVVAMSALHMFGGALYLNHEFQIIDATFDRKKNQ